MADRTGIIEYIEAGLRARSVRQAVIANNIANLQTKNFRRSTVRFESMLAEAMESGRSVKFDEIVPEIIQPRNTKVSANGNDVHLDLEIGEMVKNDVMYKAYLRILARAFRKMELAMGQRNR